MGLRFRKSVKIAPGVKVNFNKKSISTTFGTKGAHHTISTSGRKTTSVGIPGTGISYVETSNSNSDSNHNNAKKNSETTSKSNSTGKGCLGIFLGLFLVALLLALYTFAWIPALGVIIYTAFSKKYDKKQKIKQIGISTIIFITSMMLASSVPDETELTSLEISIDKTEFDINDSVEVILTATPTDSSIDSLKISDNAIVDLNYNDGKAIISFIAEGNATFHFIANDSIESNSLEVTVTDSSIINDEDTQEIDKTLPSDDQQDTPSVDGDSNSPEDTPSGDSSQGSTVVLPIVPGNSGSTDTPDEPDTPVDSDSSGNSGNSDSSNDSGPTPVIPSTPEQNTYTYVLNTNTKKFHYSSCSSVKTIKEHNYGTFEGTRDEVIAQGYEPCGRCHP